MKTLFIFLCLCCGLLAGAQDSILVYQVKGKVYLLIDNKQKELKTGNKFSGRHGRLEVEKGSSVVLINSSYQSAEFTTSQPMIYVLKTFGTKKETDVTRKYFAYVWEQFTHPHGSPENNRRKYMTNAGGVARGCPGVDAAHLPDTIFYTGKSLRLGWNNSLPAGRLHFNLRRMDLPEDSARRIAADTALFLPLQQQLKAGATWHWSLQIDRQPACAEGVIVYVTPEEYQRREQVLRREVIASDPAEAANMLGFLLESSGYIDAAQDYYRLAERLLSAENNN